VHALAHRVRARLGALPLPRVRRLLLALYLLTAAADAGGKALATNPAFNRAAADLLRREHADNLRDAARPSGNFEIFRSASQHLVSGLDLYAVYPEELADRYKYSPTFALLFAPFAWLAWPLALFLWSALNALVLFVAVERVLPPRAAMLALACLHLEVLRAMQNAQSNALVGGLIILAFVAIERTNAWKPAFAVALGACVKIFPLAALTFAIPRRIAFRAGAWTVGIGATLLLLPLLVTSPATLVAQYASWRGIESSDALQRWFSVMELVHRWTGLDLPNWPIQLAGTLALLLPLAVRRDRWDDARFRFLYLCSVLLYVVLFNHQAERASFVIAFAGATMWFAGSPRTPLRAAVYGIAFVTVPLMSTVLPVSPSFRTPTAMVYRLAVPMLVIWILVQMELLAPAREAPPSVPVPVA
jgi:hypothetical protein